MEKWHHSIQDWHRFADAVANLVEDYIRFSTDIDENDGIYVDEDDNVSLMNRHDVPDDDNFHSIVNLLEEIEGVLEVKYSAVEELTDKYLCQVKKLSETMNYLG